MASAGSVTDLPPMRQAVAGDCSAPCSFLFSGPSGGFITDPPPPPKMARVRFPVAPTRDKAAPYIAIVPDERFPGMYRLKRSGQLAFRPGELDAR